MDKSKLLVIFKIENFFIGIVITVIALVILLTSTEDYVTGLSLGILVGVWLGVILNHFIKLPKIFIKKDERQLIITIIAGAMAVGFGFLMFLLLFMLNVLNVITITRDTMTFTIMIACVIIVGLRFVTYKLMDQVL